MKGAIELDSEKTESVVVNSGSVSHRFNVEIFRLLAYLSFWLMVILAIVITSASGAVADMNDTALTKILGYNNICVYWDYEPSRSFIAMFYPIVEGLLCLYFLGHVFRCQIACLTGAMTKAELNFQLALSFFTILFGVWFRMIFVEHMDEDTGIGEQRGHVAGFLCLQICMILLETQNFFYLRATWEYGKHWLGPVAYAVYLIICGIKLILGIGVTVGKPLLDIDNANQVTFARTMDVLWMVVNAICPIFFSYYWLTHTKQTFVISFAKATKKTEGASQLARRVFAVCIVVFAAMGVVAVYSALVSEDAATIAEPPVAITLVPRHLQTVYPNIHLPVDSIFKDATVLDARMNGTTAGNPAIVFVGGISLGPSPILPAQLGQPKVQAFNALNELWLSKISPNASLRTTTPFGPESLMTLTNEVDTLSALEITIATLFRTNSFYTSALSSCKGAPCITTNGSGLFATIVRNMNVTYQRVDAILDEDLMIQSFTVSDGQGVVQASRLHAYKALAFLLNYHSEVLHASLHSAQYLLASALVHASDNSFSMATFARTYTWNIRRSYDAVVSLDLGYKQEDNAVLVGGTIGASRDGLLATMEEIILNMTAGPNAEAFVDNFLLHGLGSELASKHGVLHEFRKQAHLLDGYSTEMQNALNQSGFPLQEMESRLAWYCRNISLLKEPSKGQITKFKSWLEIQAVLAIMHTNTLSFTRFMATIAALEVSSPQENFTNWELYYWRATAPTIIGVEPGFHLFGQAPFDYNWRSLPRPSAQTPAALVQMSWSSAYPKISAVLQKFENLSFALSQEAHRVSSISEMGYLEWLTADFFENGFDGRQITYTTYF